MKPLYLLICLFAVCASGRSQEKLDLNSLKTTGSAFSDGNQCFQLTAPQLWEGGAVWYKNAINLSEPFEMELDLFFGCDDEGADGLVFIFHPRLKDGFQGEGIGFGGLRPAFGIEMDTYENPHLSDPHYDHLALMKNGQMHHARGITRPVSLLPRQRNIEDCSNHRVKINWSPASKNLKVFIDGSLRLNENYDIIRKIFNGNPIVYWGISSATGGKFNRHKVCVEKLEFASINTFDQSTIDLLTSGKDYTLKGVDFPSGKTTLEPYSNKELDKLVSLLKTKPNLHVYISGHTDDLGSVASNKSISRKRAEVVAKYLKEKGISRERIKTAGFGEEFPKLPNTSPENRKSNRRVDINLVEPRA